MLWWNATRLPFSAAWWNAPQYFPTGNISAFTENLVGIGVVFNPIFWLSGSPVLSYNVAYFLTWPLSVRSERRPPGAARETADGARTLFRIPQGPPENAPGAAIPIVNVQAVRHTEDTRFAFDGRIETGWADFPQQPDQWLTVDLGSVRDVGGVTQAIGDHLLDFPQRLAIELSTDELNRQRVWEGPTAAATLLAYVRGPREGALRFTFSPRAARFVRLRQLESYRSLWRVSELTVHGPVAQ